MNVELILNQKNKNNERDCRNSRNYMLYHWGIRIFLSFIQIRYLNKKKNEKIKQQS